MADVPKAVIYLRISQDRTGERAGVERQRVDCLKRASERGWEVVAVEVDNDLSASGKRKRPGFEAVLKAVEDGLADVVVAWSLDRLQRNRRDEVRLYELCQQRSAKLALINGADLDFGTAAGRFVADSLGSVARFEVELKSDRQRRAQQQAAEQGKRSGGAKPFGYATDGVTVIPEEAEAVRSAYDSALYGVSLHEIARQWNRQGFITGQARKKPGHEGEVSLWRADSVRNVLMNPRNIGKRAYKGEIVADAVWPAIVSEERFHAVVAMLNNPERFSGRTVGRHLLSGLALCGVCGATLHCGGGKTRAGVPTRNYRCSASTGHVARQAEPVEQYVEQAVLMILSRHAGTLLQDPSRTDSKALRLEAKGLRERLDAAAVDLADDVLTRSQFIALTKRLRARLDEVEAELADAGRVNVLGPLVQAADPKPVWDALTGSQKRAVIDILMSVTVHPPGQGARVFDPATVELKPR